MEVLTMLWYRWLSRLETQSINYAIKRSTGGVLPDQIPYTRMYLDRHLNSYTIWEKARPSSDPSLH
jgi:hypothetical protein